MKTKKELLELEKKTATLFYKSGLEAPRRILPNIIFDWITPEYCFKVRMRTLLSENNLNKNFEINQEGFIITNYKGSKPIIIKNHKAIKNSEEIIKQIKERTNIDIKII